MNGVLLIARLLLAGVFLLAGIAKLGDRTGARRALADFGAPAGVTAPLALTLPLVELAVAVALLPDASAAAAGLAAVVLLVLFSIAIGVNLRRGRTPDCHCFGQLHVAPVGGRTLARNGVLAAIAGLIAWQGPGDAADAVGWIGDLRAGEAVALAGLLVVLFAVALLGWLLLNLFRQNGRLLKRVDALEAALGTATAAALEERAGLPVGSPAPDFTLPATSGGAVTLESLAAAGRPVVLLFTDPACEPCLALAPDIGGWQREYSDRLTLAVISRKDGEQERPAGAEDDMRAVLLQEGTEVLDAYSAVGTPSAVVVSAEGKIASRAAFGAESIRTLVAELAEGGLPLARAGHTIPV